MSARVDQILEVVDEVQMNLRGETTKATVSRARMLAVRLVAARRNITINSVADKFIRQLSPQVGSTSQFDELLAKWLSDDSRELQDAILSHAINGGDRSRISNMFSKVSDQDRLIADSFALDPGSMEFREGRLKLRLHLARERNRYLVEAAKLHWKNLGALQCAACGFSFERAYGEAGRDFIEAHHNIPVSELTEETVVRPSDLSPVCSNCHGLIHRHRPWLTIQQVRSLYENHALKTNNQ